MNSSTNNKTQRRERRRARVRARVTGTASRPRLNVFRGLISLYAQLIDDEKNVTILGMHTKTGVKKGEAGERKGKVAAAYLLGKALAEAAQAKKITTVVFDRAGYAYHGRVEAVVDGMRDGGIVC